MSHREVEIVLGRLATDEALRRRFLQAPHAVVQHLVEQAGLELSAVERMALEALNPIALRRFAEALDPRLQKASPVQWTRAIATLPDDEVEEA
jgi:hypothetical protein